VGRLGNIEEVTIVGSKREDIKRRLVFVQRRAFPTHAIVYCILITVYTSLVMIGNRLPKVHCVKKSRVEGEK
jgi:hypothetical protein